MHAVCRFLQPFKERRKVLIHHMLLDRHTRSLTHIYTYTALERVEEGAEVSHAGYGRS
jgi:hypothetical protein